MMQALSIVALVESAALELIHRNDIDEVEIALIESGVSSALSAKLVQLVPSAFAAAFYEPRGVEFPQHFLVGPPGQERSVPYSSEPAYEEARRLALRWLSEGRPSLVERVLDWSAEAKGIEEATGRGLTPSRLSSISYGEQW